MEQERIIHPEDEILYILSFVEKQAKEYELLLTDEFLMSWILGLQAIDQCVEIEKIILAFEQSRSMGELSALLFGINGPKVLTKVKDEFGAAIERLENRGYVTTKKLKKYGNPIPVVAGAIILILLSGLRVKIKHVRKITEEGKRYSEREIIVKYDGTKMFDLLRSLWNRCDQRIKKQL